MIGLIIFGLASGSLLSILVGMLGSRRRIGFGWAFLASLFLTPILGLIITLLSDPLPSGSSSRMGCLGTTFGIIGMMLLILVVVAIVLMVSGLLVL